MRSGEPIRAQVPDCGDCGHNKTSHRGGWGRCMVLVGPPPFRSMLTPCDCQCFVPGDSPVAEPAGSGAP